ncbi:signal peptidase I [Streptomyces spiramenti]|uniref:Signal peptidase I n=1 Tax=Streptomyces spiramenti TaxID=2720606 RepID=A0ABX1AHZ3_9ACTN|nr:signal peptidase I [Streptomyces spiramenti]NJP65536.1 signal peptidase I [Streptomyces spiramenti]
MSAARRGRLGRLLANLTVAVGCVLFLGGFVMAAFLYQPYLVPTDSMAPTVSANDRVVAQRIDGHEVRRGDIVVFRDAAWSELPMVKRVVGVGGDHVTCCDEGGLLQVNGNPVPEPYRAGDGPASRHDFDARVPAGELFLLGDERLDSVDSRSLLADGGTGTVAEDAVVARVEAVAWPPGRAGLVSRPGAFAELPGGVSDPGPLRLLVTSTLVGAVLILVGSTTGAITARVARRKA